MPYKTKGKCVYKKDTGEKVGCTDGSVKDYLAALHANANEGLNVDIKGSDLIQVVGEELSRLLAEWTAPGLSDIGDTIEDAAETATSDEFQLGNDPEDYVHVMHDPSKQTSDLMRRKEYKGFEEGSKYRHLHAAEDYAHDYSDPEDIEIGAHGPSLGAVDPNTGEYPTESDVGAHPDYLEDDDLIGAWDHLGQRFAGIEDEETLRAAMSEAMGEIRAPAKMRIVDVDTDCDSSWGCRVVGEFYDNAAGKWYHASFSHMEMDSIPDLKAGDIIESGQVVGRMGGTGGYAPHLHYEMWEPETDEEGNRKLYTGSTAGTGDYAIKGRPTGISWSEFLKERRAMAAQNRGEIPENAPSERTYAYDPESGEYIETTPRTTVNEDKLTRNKKMNITKEQLKRIIKEEMARDSKLEEIAASPPISDPPRMDASRAIPADSRPAGGPTLGSSVSSMMKKLGTSGSTTAASKFQEKPLQRAMDMVTDVLSKANERKKREFLVTLLDQLGIDPQTLSLAKSELTALQQDRGSATPGLGDEPTLQEVRTSLASIKQIIMEELSVVSEGGKMGHYHGPGPGRGEPDEQMYDILKGERPPPRARDVASLMPTDNTEASMTPNYEREVEQLVYDMSSSGMNKEQIMSMVEQSLDFLMK